MPFTDSPGAGTNGTAIKEGRGRGFLERCDCTAKGPVTQKGEVLTTANVFTWLQMTDCVCVCVCVKTSVYHESQSRNTTVAQKNNF